MTPSNTPPGAVPLCTPDGRAGRVRPRRWWLALAALGLLLGTGQAAQAAITFPAQAVQTFSPGATFELNPVATNSRGYPVTYRGGAPVCSISGTTVTILTSGTCTITAQSQAAEDVSRNITISRAPAPIEIVSAPGTAKVFPFGHANHTFDVRVTSINPRTMSYQANTPSVCTISKPTADNHLFRVSTQSAGECSFNVYTDTSAADNYQGTTRTISITLLARTPQTITFGTQSSPPTYRPGGTYTLNPAATIDSPLPVSYRTTTPAVCAISGTSPTVTILSGGNCNVIAEQAGDDDYAAATLVARSFNIGRATQIVVFNPGLPTELEFVPNGTFTVSATTSSGLAPSYGSSSSAVCSVDTNTGVVTMLSEGNCLLYASHSGNSSYLSATPSTHVVKLEMSRTPQTISFAGAQFPQRYAPSGTFTLDPLASATSGLPVVYSSLTSNKCTISGTTVSIVEAGTCTIAADQAGDATWAAAPQVTQNITINPATQTVVFDPEMPAEQEFVLNRTFTVSATASSGLEVTFASTTSGVCTVSGNTVTMKSAGNCIVRAEAAGNVNYGYNFVQGTTLLKAKTAQAIIFDGSQAAQTYAPNGTFALEMVATASSGLPVVYSSLTPDKCTISGTTISIVEAGTCTIAADQPGDATYAAAPQMAKNITILQGSQTISFTPPTTQEFVLNGTFTVSATASSGLPVSFVSDTASVCTVSGNTVTMLSAGNCQVTASQSGNVNYPGASVFAGIELKVKDPQTINFNAQPPQTYAPSGTFALVPASATSGLPVVYSALTANKCSISGTTISIVEAGTCTIAADQAGDATYAAAPQVTQDITINRAAPDLVFNPSARQSYVNGGNFTVSASTGSGQAMAFASTTPAVCSVSGGSVTMLSEGDCKVTATIAASTNYTALELERTIVLSSQQAQVITFGAQAAQEFVQNGTFFLNPQASASSGLAVSYSTLTGYVCSINAHIVTMLAEGTCTIAADQAGDAAWLAAARVTQDIVIVAVPVPVQQPQAITFGAQQARDFVLDGTFGLNPLATSDSGLAVSYSTLTGAVCRINGGAVTMLAAGTCSIAADQAGDANYLPATRVVQDITIKAAATPEPEEPKPEDPKPNPEDGDPTDPKPEPGKQAQAITGFRASVGNPVFTANGTFTVSASGGDSGNPVQFASTTPQVCSVNGNTVTMLAAGTCALTASQAGNAQFDEATPAMLSVAIGAAAPVLGWTGNLEATEGDADFELADPDSNSSGAFTFTSSNTAVATVDGRRVRIVGAGTTTLTATQAATGNHVAGSVSVELSVGSRPDPTRQVEVTQAVQAQANVAARFATAQRGNLNDRLRTLRSGHNPSTSNLSFGVAGSQGPGLSLNARPVQGQQQNSGWGVWMAGVITLGKQDNRAGRNDGFDWRSDGITAGMDFRVNERLLLGGAAGLGWTDTDFNDGRSRQDGKQRSVSLYGLWKVSDRLFLDGSLGMGSLDFDMERWHAASGSTAHGSRDGDQTFGSLTFGYEQDMGTGKVAGYGRVNASRTQLDAYEERGAGAQNLRYDRQTVDNTAVAVGVEGRYGFKTERSVVRPYWSLEYQHTLDSHDQVRIGYLSRPTGEDYLLSLDGMNRNLFSLGTGLDIEMKSGWLVSLLLRREQSRDASANSIGLTLRYGSNRHVAPYADGMPLDRLPGWLEPERSAR